MEIKDKNGKVLYTLNFAHYGEERDTDANDDEKTIAEHIRSLCPTSKLVRLSDDYLTIKCVDTDIARFKYTERARWILFPYLANKKKRYFDSLEDLTEFDDAIRESYEKACKTDKVE